MSVEYTQALLDHYGRNWGPVRERLRFLEGPVDELSPGFLVARFARTAGMDVYATVHMSEPEEDERIELHMTTRAQAIPVAEIVELLTIVAHYHRTGARLNLGHTVKFGRPWVVGGSCTHGLVSLPYLDGPSLEWLQEPRTRCLWLVPITANEAAFKVTNGVEALESRLELANVDYLNSRRDSVV